MSRRNLDIKSLITCRVCYTRFEVKKKTQDIPEIGTGYDFEYDPTKVKRRTANYVQSCIVPIIQGESRQPDEI